jgi:hypothetical protein
MQVMDHIEGRNGMHLPWEGESLTAVNRSRLGVFRGVVLMLLSRDPADRPSMEQFCKTCDRVLQRWAADRKKNRKKVNRIRVTRKFFAIGI